MLPLFEPPMSLKLKVLLVEFALVKNLVLTQVLFKELEG
jgi:hypothetical protein